MTYNDKKIEFGHEPAYILVLSLDRCIHEYGISPCTATDSVKCFNTLASCKDVPNYSLGCTTTDSTCNRFDYAFSNVTIDDFQEVGSAPVFPCIIGEPSTAPTVLQPGKGLSIRSTVKVQLSDFPWTDRGGVDPYIDDRTYDVENTGTFLGRLISRNPYYEGRPATLYSGYLDENGRFVSDNFKTRSYIIHRISGPSTTGIVDIELKDPIKATDNDRAQWPLPTGDFIQLLDDLPGPDDGTYSPTLDISYDSDNEEYIEDWYNDDQRYIRINNEIMEVTSLNLAADTISVNRATLPSYYPSDVMSAQAHKTDDGIQLCWNFDTERVDDIIYFLLVTASEIDSSYIDITEWNNLADNWLSAQFYSCLLTEPIGIKTLLNEISQHLILLWWDERAQLIKLDAIKPIPTNDPVPEFTDDDNLVAGTVSVTKDVSNRLSQVWLYFGQRNPVEQMDETDNYARIDVSADLDAETKEEYGSTKIKKIFSRWLDSSRSAVALEITGRLLNFYVDTKPKISISINTKDDQVWTGDSIDVLTQFIQDLDGNPHDYRYLITEVNEQLSADTLEYTAIWTGAIGRSGVITCNDAPDPALPGGSCTLSTGTGDFPDYTSASSAIKNKYAFISNNDDEMSNGDPGYVIS